MRYAADRPFCTACESILEPFEPGEEPWCDCSDKPEIITWGEEVDRRVEGADRDVVAHLHVEGARQERERIVAWLRTHGHNRAADAIEADALRIGDLASGGGA